MKRRNFEDVLKIRQFFLVSGVKYRSSITGI
jgi:hypothetical protein